MIAKLKTHPALAQLRAGIRARFGPAADTVNALFVNHVAVLGTTMAATTLGIWIVLVAFTPPGLAERIGHMFAQLHLDLGLSFDDLMTAFAIANIALLNMCAMVIYVLRRNEGGDLTERLDELDNGQTALLDEVGELRGDIERLRHELVAVGEIEVEYVPAAAED